MSADGTMLPIKRIADVSLGKMIQPRQKTPSDVLAPYLRAAHIQPHGEIADVESKQMWFSPSELRSNDLRVGDVVVVEGGAGFGRSAHLDDDLKGWSYQNSIVRIRARAGKSIGSFINYALQAALSAGEIEVVCNAATLQHFTAEKVAAFKIPVPTIPLQRAVADYLDRETDQIDAFIADQEELIALLRERRTATTTHAVTRGLDPGVPMKDSGIQWIGKIPSHWHLRRLWTLFDREKNVGHPDEQMLSVFRDHGVVPKDSMANLNQTADNRNIYQLVTPGWLVSNRMKAWQGSVGISTYRGIVSGHYICFRPKHNEHSPYLNYLFRSRAYTAGYNSISRGVRIGQAEIDNDEYRLLPVLLPPLSEQRYIAEYLDRETGDIDAAIADAREAIALSKERRAAVISAAVTGEIDVRDLMVPGSTTKMGAETVGVA